jgi:hypothetical protein
LRKTGRPRSRTGGELRVEGLFVEKIAVAVGIFAVVMKGVLYLKKPLKEMKFTSPKSPVLRLTLGLILLLVFFVLADLQYRDVGGPVVALMDVAFGIVMFVLIVVAVVRGR